MWSLRRSGSTSMMSSSDFDSSQGSIMVSSEASTGPSRLDSFSSSGGFGAPSNDFTMQTSFDEKVGNIPTSPISSNSSHGKVGAVSQLAEPISTTNSTTDHSTNDQVDIEELEIVKSERAVSPTIQKWVDESCAQTERLKSSGKLSPIVISKHDEEIREEETPASDLAIQQALEYSLRSVSPNFARTGSLDGAFTSLGDFQSQMTPTESMLLGLGFGGPDLGIPVRFLKSWREQVIKRKITELQGLLGRSRKSPSPTGSARQYNPKPVQAPKCQEITQARHPSPVAPNKDKVKQQTIQQQSVITKSVVKPSEKQLQLEKLKNMRQQLRRSATFSAFSPNALLDLKQSNGKDHRKKGAMSDKKYQKLRGATRGNAKDRRRVFGTRQSSLPISLETLPEEDEGSRPLFLQQKSSSLDLVDDTISADASSATSLNSSQHDVRIDGSETGSAVDPLERFQRNGPKIVMSGPSSSLDSVLSEGGNLANTSETFEEKYDGNHLLVVKNMIESKDSGFGNDISNGGSPQLSPEHQAQACLSGSRFGGVMSSADNPTKTKTNHSTDTQEWKRKTDKSNEKLGRVDLCIQCDFTDSDSESDVECFSAGVQTSPWLQSGELSPLLCSETDSSDRTGTQDSGSKGTSLLNNYHSDINGIDSELSEQKLLSDNSNLPYPDGFNSERRRLSRIEEVTEGTMSYQSEEDKIKPSLGSQQDSSQTMSTDSSSRPNSSLVVYDSLRANEELHSENFERTSDHDFKRLRKKIYKEMLNRNLEPDLMHEEKLIQLRAAYQQEKVPNHLTVDETLIKAAEKLELCLNEEGKHDASEEQDRQIPEVKGKEEPDINRDTVHKNVHQHQHIPQSFPKSSSGTSPNEQLGSIRSRHFFASNSFLSFTENVRHSGRSSATSESDVSDVASFFSVPINLENGEEEFDFNFSLTGSDMNLVSGEDDLFPIFSVNEGLLPFWEKEHSFGEEDNCKSENVVSEQSYSDNPNVNSVKGTGGFLSRAYINKKADSLQTHSIDKPRESSDRKDLPSKASKGDYFSPPYQVGAFSESNMDLVSQHGNVFTETLEIEVPSLHQEKNVELSQCFVALQPVIHDGYLNSLRNERSIPCRYSSKYYFSIDDYSLESGYSPNEAAKNKTTLSTRRRSLIDAHLSAKKFDEFVCAKSVEDRRSGSEEVLQPPFVAVSKEIDSEDERVSTASLMSPKQNEGREGSNSFGDVVSLHQGHTKWDNIPSFNRMSSDSQASLGSSVTSSKVEQYVDSVLEYALEDVRGSEVDKNKFKNAIPVTLHSAHDGAGLNTYSTPSCQENAHTHGMFHKDIYQASLEDSGVLCNGNDTREDHTLYQPSWEDSQYEGVDFQSRLAIANQKKCKQITTETGKDNVVTDNCQLTLCPDGRTTAAAHDDGHLQDGGGLVLVNGNKTESLNKRCDNVNNGFVHSLDMNSNPNRSSSDDIGQTNGDRKVCLGQINFASNNLNEGRELKSDPLQGNRDGGELEHDPYFLRQPESSSHIPKRVTGSCDSNESDLQPRQLQEYLSQEEELGQLPARESEFSQKIQYLISAEEDLREQVQELETSMGSIQEKKKMALDDLKSLQETVQRSRSEIQRAETIARESVGKAEDIRSELVVLEYQRDQASRELGDIEQNVLFSRSLQTGPPPHHRMIRSMDNIHLVTSPNTRPQTQVVSDVREAAQFNSVPHDLVVGQKAYRDRQTYSPGERLTDQDNQTVNYREMDDKLKDFLSDSLSTTDHSNQSSILTPPIYPLLGDDGDGTDEDLPLLTHSNDIYPIDAVDQDMLKPHYCHNQERDKSSQKFKEAREEIANLRQETEIQKETIREAEDKLHKSLHDSSQTQNHLQNEIIALRSQLHEKVMKVTELEGTIQERERALQSARESLVDVQERVHMLQKGKEEIIRTNTEECQKLEANREVALVELRERLLNEKEGALQQLQFELEKDKEESVTKVQEELEKVRKLMKAELEERIDELTDLKGKLKQLEESKKTLGIQMRKEAEEQIQRAILTEREIWQMEAERKQEAEKRVMEESLGGEVKRMRVEMEKLKQDKDHLKESMKILKEENNKLRDENLAAGREKVEAVSEAREETRKDIQAQLDKMREDMSQEKMRETEKLREKLKNQDEELGKLRSEVRGHQQREKESLLSVNVEKSDRSLIQELNEECKKSANILGVTPRKTAVFVNVKSSAAGKSPSTVEPSHEAPGSGYLPTRSQLHSALSNLKLTNDELRNMAKKFKEDGKQWQKEVMKERKVKESEIEKLQSSISHEREDKANLQEVQEEHEAEVDKLKRSLQKIKLQEKSNQEQLQQKDDNMREVQKNMKTWKEETALKMARKFEEELNRELEQRVLNLSLQDDASFSHSSGSRSMDASHSGQDANTVKVLKHLQEKVKQLKMENLHLKRGRKREDVRGDDSTSNGSSNGQYSNKDHHIYKLEQKVKLLERQLSVAEERCRENAGLLSKNSLDTSKLETALTQQTKELMKMERAYERLSQSTSPYGK